MMKTIFKYRWLVLSGLALFLFVALIYLVGNEPRVKPIIEIKKAEEKPAPKTPQPKAVALPESKELIVPYTVQAPFANWKVHEESCEEAATLMYHRYLQGEPADISPTEADKIFREMKTWQVKNYGKEPDLTIRALGEFSQSYYGYRFKEIAATKEAVTKEIAAGNPVLFPVMTHSLKNPHYGRENTYHILLIKGYDTAGVITNDAGIREGKNWKYSWEILWQAVAAQTVSPKVGLVLEK